MAQPKFIRFTFSHFPLASAFPFIFFSVFLSTLFSAFSIVHRFLFRCSYFSSYSLVGWSILFHVHNTFNLSMERVSCFYVFFWNILWYERKQQKKLCNQIHTEHKWQSTNERVRRSGSKQTRKRERKRARRKKKTVNEVKNRKTKCQRHDEMRNNEINNEKITHAFRIWLFVCAIHHFVPFFHFHSVFIFIFVVAQWIFSAHNLNGREMFAFTLL